MRSLFIFASASLCTALVIGSAGAQGGRPDTFMSHLATNRNDIKTHRSGETVVREVHTRADSDRAGLVLVWAELPISSSLVVAGVGKYGPSYETFEQSVPRTSVAAVNGGFFGYDTKGKHMPLGLVIVDGQTRNRQIRWTTGGILLKSADEIQLIPIRQKRPVIIEYAVQSKPLLVENGAVAIRSHDTRFNRSAIALTRRRSVVVAGAFDSFGRAATLKEFATFLAGLRTIDNLEIDTALAMDGGPGAQLYFPQSTRHYGEQGNNYVPNLVYFSPRGK